MPPRQRFTKDALDDDGGPGKPEQPSEAMLQWDVLSTIHQWREELDQELIEHLLKVAATMGYKKHVAHACGVRPALFEWWLSEGMRGDAPALMQQLSCRYHMVTGFSTAQALSRISQAGARGDWQSDAWMLSHRHPEWAQRKESSTPDLGIEVDTAPPQLSLADRRQQMRFALEEAKRTGKGELADTMREAGLLPPSPQPKGDAQ